MTPKKKIFFFPTKKNKKSFFFCLRQKIRKKKEFIFQLQTMDREQYFKFQEEASEDNSLQTIREDVERIQREHWENEEPPSDSEGNSDDEEEEHKGRKTGRRRKGAPRISSPFLRNLIEKYSPEYGCDETEADTSCLLHYVESHIPFFGNKYTDEKLFAVQLEQLSKIIHHLFLRTSSMQNYFTMINNAFRDFYMPKGEKFFEPWKKLTEKILHVERQRVLKLLKERGETQTKKLQDGFVERWDTIDHHVREMFRRGEEGHTKSNGAATLLALELCVGGRKTSFLDPNVKFYTWQDWKENHRHDNDNQMGVNDIGTPELSLTLQDLSDDKFTSSVIVQVGILKDAAMKLQKHLPEDERDDPKFVVKPCLIYTAEYLVQKIKDFRRKFSINKETFISRKKSGNSWGTRLFHPLLDEYFHDSLQKAKRNGWRLGSHHMRRIYIMATINFFKDSAEAASGKVLAQNLWMALLLAHMGSIATSISYSNLKIIYSLPHESFQLPPLELIHQLAKQVFDLQKQVDLLKAVPPPQAEPVEEIGFLTPDGKTVTFTKHAKRKYKNEQDKLDTVYKQAKKLHDNGLAVNKANLGRLGFGRELQDKFFQTEHNFASNSPEQKQEQSQAQPRFDNPPPAELDEKHNDQPKQKKQRTTHKPNTDKNGYHKLRENEKIVSFDPNSTEKANAERYRRDVKKYGVDKVLKHPEECDGPPTEPILIDYKTTRVVC